MLLNKEAMEDLRVDMEDLLNRVDSELFSAHLPFSSRSSEQMVIEASPPYIDS